MNILDGKLFTTNRTCCIVLVVAESGMFVARHEFFAAQLTREMILMTLCRLRVLLLIDGIALRRTCMGRRFLGVLDEYWVTAHLTLSIVGSATILSRTCDHIVAKQTFVWWFSCCHAFILSHHVSIFYCLSPLKPNP